MQEAQHLEHNQGNYVQEAQAKHHQHHCERTQAQEAQCFDQSKCKIVWGDQVQVSTRAHKLKRCLELCHHLHTRNIWHQRWPKTMYKIETQRSTGIQGEKGTSHHHHKSFRKGTHVSLRIRNERERELGAFKCGERRGQGELVSGFWSGTTQESNYLIRVSKTFRV